MRDVSSKQGERLRALESDQRLTSESARDARNAALQLASRVDDNERTTARAITELRDGLVDVEKQVRDMAQEQTPILKDIRDENVARRAIEKDRAEERARARAKDEAIRKWAIVLVPLAIAIIGLCTSYVGTKAARPSAPPTMPAPAPAH